VKPGELYCSATTGSSAATQRTRGRGTTAGWAEPTLLATDPPYGVQLDQTWRDGVYNGRGSGCAAGASSRAPPSRT